MPRRNRFRHQSYRSTRPRSPHHWVRPGKQPKTGAEEFTRRMRGVGEAFRSAGVAAIYLAHGTFVGGDALGLAAELARVLPSAAGTVRRMMPKVVAELTGDAGNYTAAYARMFESAINSAGQPRITVRLFHWSSENHHLGRADGAVRLIDELAAGDFQPGQRVLLWGHSHAGNMFALLTNLLAAEPEVVESFFEAAEVYYRWPVLGLIDIPVWNRVRGRLRRQPIGPAALDVVTFGTPIRYGWDSDGYARLLHFVHRRPAEGWPPHRAPFPPKLKRLMRSADGDYVQQLGIAGTNVAPSVLSWRAWLADRRLHRLLQAEAADGKISDRFEAGAIVPEEGTTLLVDYGAQDGSVFEPCAGHAIYTRKEWLLFHAEEVARRFYADRACRVA